MKKLLLIAAFGLMASPALAQNTAVTSSTGDDNLATTVQNTGTGNEGLIDQLGDDNTADLTQTGTNSRVIIGQGTFTPAAFGNPGTPGTSTNNTAIVTQSGADHTGPSFGFGGPGIVVLQGQSGSVAIDNIATVDQAGERNRAFTLQGGNSTDSFVRGSAVTVDQNGSDNNAEILQADFGGTSQGDQATILQRVGTSGGQSNSALVTQGLRQNSSNSEALVVQDGASDMASVDQGGDNQFVRVLQGANGGTSSFNNVTVSQVDGGAGNAVYIDQGTPFFGGMVSASGNDASVLQNGVDNRADIQQGTDLQSAAAYETVTNSEATISQTGEANFARIAQGGDNQRGDIAQTGNSNFALLFQIGSDHIVLLDQQDDGTANIFQDGNGSAVVGVGSDLVSGTLLRAQSNGGSTLDVDQLGDGNVLFLDQNNGGTATVMQDGMTNTATVVQN